jgi:hypothetical protein
VARRATQRSTVGSDSRRIIMVLKGQQERLFDHMASIQTGIVTPGQLITSRVSSTSYT